MSNFIFALAGFMLGFFTCVVLAVLSEMKQVGIWPSRPSLPDRPLPGPHQGVKAPDTRDQALQPPEQGHQQQHAKYKS